MAASNSWKKMLIFLRKPSQWGGNHEKICECLNIPNLLGRSLQLAAIFLSDPRLFDAERRASLSEHEESAGWKNPGVASGFLVDDSMCLYRAFIPRMHIVGNLTIQP